MKPLSVFGHWGAPNPWKVRLILEELGIPHEWQEVEFTAVKADDYLAVTPNGRLPAIQDPNTGITLWESGAIILYLIDTYDKECKLSYKEGPEKYLTQQWLMFQVSGQGPYYGQAAWFARFHPERIPSATTRYIDEIERVVSVLDLALSRNAKDSSSNSTSATNHGPYLVGDKATYADLSFVTWANVGKGLLMQLGEMKRLDKYSHYHSWMERLEERSVVKSVNERVEAGRKAHNLP